MSDNKGKKGAQGKGKGTPTQDKKADAAPAESKQEKVVEKKPVEKKDDVAPDVRQEEGNASTPTSARKTGATNQGATEKKENRVQQVRESGKGVVKAVLSGDTIVVINLAKNQQGPPQERIISLSNISAPSMGRKRGDKEERDKPFAWDSREFLRKKLIGKPVTYVVEAKMPNKEYGAIFLENENIALSVVENGWATVRRPNRSEGPLYEALKEMIDAEEAARKAGKGLHDKSKEGTVRPAAKEINPTELFTKLKGQPQTGIVEKVKNGNTLSVTLLPSFNEVTIILSGVDCPSSNPNNPEPFGREAKFFTEHHLLNREVSVILEGADKNNFYGTVSYANRYISEELLKQGLGKYVDWSGMRTAFHDRLKAAENEAKEKKLRIWASYVAPKPLTRQEEKKVAKPGREITGTVVEVANAGCITIQDPSGVEHKIYLSSIKVPRQGAPTPAKDESKEDAAERYFAWEGKEYLRRRLIGNRVRCVLDYTREGPPKSQGKGKDAKPEDRNYCSVYLDKNNVAVELVEQGLAKPSDHRGGEQRSRDYEHIIFAESRAQKAGKGQYAPKEKVATVNIVDISQDVKLAKQKFPFLQRHGKMRGVIEYEFSPSRFKIFVPKENCQIILSLGGVQTPTRESDHFKAALNFVRAKAHQHDIDFDVQAQDTKGAGFIGNIWVNKQSLAVIILEEGYGKIFRGAERDNEMLSAESIAKKKKRGIWVNYNEEEENAKRQAAYEATKEDKKQKQQEFVDVVVTEIVDGTTLWVQVVGPAAQQLEELMQKLAVDDNSPEHKPLLNELVKAQFTADDTWYRARVLKVMDNNEYKVQYVDYGNTEVIPGSRIRRLDPELKEKFLAPQATEAVLAFLKTPPVDDEFGREAVEFLRELVWGKTMMANVERREKLPDGSIRLHLSLGDRESQVLVNAALLRAGLARVDRVRGEQYREMLDKLREEESKARQAHHGIWEYGDPGSDEDEDDRRGGKGKGKRT